VLTVRRGVGPLLEGATKQRWCRPPLSVRPPPLRCSPAPGTTEVTAPARAAWAWR